MSDQATDEDRRKAASVSYFLLAPNSYIGGRRPVELADAEPELLVSLLRAFLRPADVF